MNKNDILNHFFEVVNWIERKNSVDRFIVDYNNSSEILKCTTTWIADLAAINFSINIEAQLIICHEPLFWNHYDHIDETDSYVQKKLKLLKDNNLSVIRIHDCWDTFPKIGIPFAWAEFLGINSEPIQIFSEKYQHKYVINPVKIIDLLNSFSIKCAELGEPKLQFIGDLNKTVKTIGIGTGCACDIRKFMESGCELSVVCDDGSAYWREIQFAIDNKHPIIRVNHATSEEPGMQTLNKYLNEVFPEVEFIHYKQGCRYSNYTI